MRIRNFVVATMLAIVGVPAGTAEAQPGSPGYESPEVHPDRRVTLRLRAPQAEEVTVAGEILEGRPPAAMTRDADGIWTLTLGPLPPDVYTYAFRVDGVAMPDPINPYVKTGALAFGVSSQVQVPGDGPHYYDVRSVPQGMVSIVQYRSVAMGVPRTAWVYTPPGYLQSGETYPALYLLHGIGDTEVGWTLTGRANLILDNLIADGEARPMIVVMPYGHARQSLGIGPPAASRAEGTDVFQVDLLREDLLGDLIPVIEETFRVSTDPDERAIMGLSMGGRQALQIGLTSLDAFRWIVGLSAALVGADPLQPFAGVLSNADEVNRNVRLLYVTIGEGDGLIEGNRAFSAALTEAGIHHTFRTTEGGHWWRVWRRDLYEIAPLLFR